MGIAERKLRQKEEMRTAILEAAWQLVLADGWQSLSIRKIAEAIEYSVPVIYHHFENKDAILLEFTRQGFQQLTQEVEEACQKESDVASQLEAMAQAYWNFAFNHQEYYQLMFGLGIPTCETVNRVAEMKSFSHMVVEVLRRAIARSSHPEVDPWLKFHTYWSILHGLVSIQMISKQAIVDPRNQPVLQDAVSGFVKLLQS